MPFDPIAGQNLDPNLSLIRVSSGTAIVLGLLQGKLDARANDSLPNDL